MRISPFEKFVTQFGQILHGSAWGHDEHTKAIKHYFTGTFVWTRTFLKRLHTKFAKKPTRDLIRLFIENDSGVQKVWKKKQQKFAIKRVMLPSPVDAKRPNLKTTQDLAEWLGYSVRELQWYADIKGLNRQGDNKLHHYTVRWIPKRSANGTIVKHRLIEMPKTKLKEIQSILLHELLDGIPPHQAACGFRPGGSILKYAQPHAGRPVVLRFDLADFFPSISYARICSLFQMLGYQEAVAKTLAGLCTTRLRRVDWDRCPSRSESGLDHPIWQRLSGPHLP